MRFIILIAFLLTSNFFTASVDYQQYEPQIDKNPGAYIYISVSGDFYFDPYNLEDKLRGYLITGIFYTRDMVRRSGNYYPNDTDLCIDFLDYIDAFSEEYGFYRFVKGSFQCHVNAYESRKEAKRSLVKEINSKKDLNLYYQLVPYDD